MAKLATDFLDRLEENKKLYEQPGLGKYSESTASFIGTHGFWVLLLISCISTVIFLRMDLHWLANDTLFGWMY
jgi:hypothetical protein